MFWQTWWQQCMRIYIVQGAQTPLRHRGEELLLPGRRPIWWFQRMCNLKLTYYPSYFSLVIHIWRAASFFPSTLVKIASVVCWFCWPEKRGPFFSLGWWCRYQGSIGAAAKALAATELLMDQLTPRNVWHALYSTVVSKLSCCWSWSFPCGRLRTDACEKMDLGSGSRKINCSGFGKSTMLTWAVQQRH